MRRHDGDVLFHSHCVRDFERDPIVEDESVFLRVRHRVVVSQGLGWLSGRVVRGERIEAIYHYQTIQKLSSYSAYLYRIERLLFFNMELH